MIRIKKTKAFLFTLVLGLLVIVLAGCIPTNSTSPYIFDMPTNWVSINSMAVDGNIVLIGGTTNANSAAIGEYDLSNGNFSDLSNLLKSFQMNSVSSIAFANGVFFVAGTGNNVGMFLSFNPSINMFTNLTPFLTFAGSFSALNSISVGGSSVLIGGTGSKTPLVLYHPANPHVFSSVSVTENFTVNNIVWDGTGYFVDGVNSNYYPAVGKAGYFTPSNDKYEELSGSLPQYTGTIGGSGYDGQGFLAWSKNNSTLTWPNGFNEMLNFDPSASDFKVITAFATDLTVGNGGISGANGWFVVGGKVPVNQPYLAKYDLSSGNPIDLSSFLPYGTMYVSKVLATGGDLYIGGAYQSGKTFFEIVKNEP